MAAKVFVFVLASFLLVSATVSLDAGEQASTESAVAVAPVSTPTPAPVKAPPQAPVKAPPQAPVKAPPQVPVKAPPQAPVKTPPKAPAPAPIPYMPPVNITACPGLCGGRCKLHSRPRHCSRVCITCCQRCKCVPPGTYGNKEMCGKCYTDMTTHGGRPKCP